MISREEFIKKYVPVFKSQQTETKEDYLYKENGGKKNTKKISRPKKIDIEKNLIDIYNFLSKQAEEDTNAKVKKVSDMITKVLTSKKKEVDQSSPKNKAMEVEYVEDNYGQQEGFGVPIKEVE